ncbi:MAG TPA: PIN domain nuclease [Desulfobacteraceae bacterium]|nr:PIN domain nuclease [Desulfobacteraceae bacterium]
MRHYVLDTDICIYWLNGNEHIRKKIEKAKPENLRITSVTLAELRYGAYNSQRIEENLKNIDNFLRKARVLSLDQKAADKFGEIKANLRKKGEIICDFDILIASITLRYDGILVTNNTDHFKRINELRFENWV